MSNRPILKRRSDAAGIAHRFGNTLGNLFRLKYHHHAGLMKDLSDYWYIQIKLHGWRRLSGRRVEELVSGKQSNHN